MENTAKLIQTNFTIVRGLAYYDGFCVETNLNFKVRNPKGKEIDIGSICFRRSIMTNLYQDLRGTRLPRNRNGALE